MTHCYVDRNGRRNCDHVHAEDLPANNPELRGEIPDTYYEGLDGWTAQFQTNYDEKRHRFIESAREQGVEIIDEQA